MLAQTLHWQVSVVAITSKRLSLLKDSLRRRQQVVVEKIAIACRLQLFVSLCGGIIKHDTELKRKVKR